MNNSECETSFDAQEELTENDAENISNCNSGSLVEYMKMLSTSADHQDIDFDHVESLLLKGAGVNDTCREGESVLHEVAANWDTEVADFFFKKGASVSLKDDNGRTPLHMAASSNHVKMIEWLINHGADIEAKTFQEKQTPFHYAARYNSVEAIELLFDKGGNQDVQDYQGRTPLHLAAELDRTFAADCLVNLPEPAEVRVQDYQGNIAIASMTRTMPNVVSSALDQLYRICSPSRKQYFILSHLEPVIENHGKGVKTPFEVAVEEKHRQVLSHKVMQALISEKWRYIRWLFYPHLVFDIVFTTIWSVLIAYPSVQQKHSYIFPQDSWRVLIGVTGILLYLCKVVMQALEMARSIFKHRIWVRSHGRTIHDDLAIQTQTDSEKLYLQTKLSDLLKSWPVYFRDPWNLCTSMTNLLLLLFIILHIGDVANHSTTLATWVARVSCLVCLSMWLCLLKQARGFRALGALIAIVGELFGDIFRFFFLFALIFIPYLISFWVMFGGDQSTSLSDEDRKDLISFYRVIIMVFRMSLIDDYPYSGMRDLDEAMAAVLVTTVLLFLAVVALNLFIALLSDTFQRVYDNAQANSLLEQV